MIGKAQEKTTPFRTHKRHGPHACVRNARLHRTTASVNQVYCIVFDQAFAPFFLKLRSYFPYTTKFCFNRHEYLKRRIARAKIAHQAFNNGLRSCVDPAPRQIGFPANPRLLSIQSLPLLPLG